MSTSSFQASRLSVFLPKNIWTLYVSFPLLLLSRKGVLKKTSPYIPNILFSLPSLLFHFSYLLSWSTWFPLSPSLSNCGYIGDIVNDKYICLTTWPDVCSNKSLFMYLEVLPKTDTNNGWRSSKDFWEL